MGLMINPNGKLEVVSHGHIDCGVTSSKVEFAWHPVTVIENGVHKRIWLKRYKAMYYNDQNIMNVAL